MQSRVTVNNPIGYKYVSSYLDRHGQRRWRYRKAGRTFQLGTEYGTPEFQERLKIARLSTGMDNLEDHSGSIASIAINRATPTVDCGTPIAPNSRKRRSGVGYTAQVVEACQKLGLHPTSIVLQADGSTQIRYSESGNSRVGYGWEDM